MQGRDEPNIIGLSAVVTYVDDWIKTTTGPKRMPLPPEVMYQLRSADANAITTLAQVVQRRMPNFTLERVKVALHEIKREIDAPAPAAATTITATPLDDTPNEPTLSDEATTILTWLKQWDKAGRHKADVPGVNDTLVALVGKASGGQLAQWGWEIGEATLSYRWTELFEMHRVAVEALTERRIKTQVQEIVETAVKESIAKRTAN